MPELSLDDWNAYLGNHPDAHVLQTGEWGELKSAFGWTAVRTLTGGIGAQILFRRLPLGYTFAYLPKGPILPSSGIGHSVLDQFWSDVDRLCRARRAIFLKAEPDAWESAVDPAPADRDPMSTPSPQHIQPRRTLVVPLDGSQDDIFDRMKPKTRYNIRLAGRKGVVVRPSQDLEGFYRLMTVTSKRMGFHVHSLNYYRHAYELFHPSGMCELLVADLDGKFLATVMVFARGRRAYYFYGASSDEERNRKPTYPLQWEAIRWAKGRGCEEYDMWGIPDEDEQTLEAEGEEREDGLWGVYRFKKGFGGSVMRAVQTQDRVYNGPLYRLYLWRFAGSGQD